MTHGLVLKSSALVFMVFGLAFVFMPNELLAMYKVEALNRSGVYNTMLLGSTFIGIGFMNWAASSARAIEEVRYVIVGNLAVSIAGFVVAITRQLTSAGAPQASWLNVALYLLFAVLFGYLYSTRLATSGSANTSVRG